MSGRGKAGILRRIALWILCVAAACVLLLAGLVALYAVVPPVSTLMVARTLTFRTVERTWVPLADISPNLPRAVIMSEDSQFCRHGGVDWSAINLVLDKSGEDGPSRGASTIAMQTVKNLFLWPSRSVIRKGIEIPLALVIDAVWSKKRIMEVYLNIAEWGDGIFGAEAASRHYFRKGAADLTPRDSALLAAALPNPILRDPSKPGRRHALLARIVAARAQVAREWTACLR